MSEEKITIEERLEDLIVQATTEKSHYYVKSVCEDAYARIRALEDEAETLRLKLAACGVAAMCNTRESARKQTISKDNPHYSASYEDICDAVNREMDLREENHKLKAALELCKKQRNEAILMHRDNYSLVLKYDKELEEILE